MFAYVTVLLDNAQKADPLGLLTSHISHFFEISQCCKLAVVTAQ